MRLNLKNIIMLILFILISFNANANLRTLEIGFVYNQCKPYQNLNFNFKRLSKSDQIKAMFCRTTLIGIVNTGYNLCQSLRWYYKDGNTSSKKILMKLSSWYANELVENENRLIAGFNEWAENNQHIWKEVITGVTFKRDYIAKQYYCHLN